MWRIDGATLTGLGQTWSSPTPTKVNIDGVEHLARRHRRRLRGRPGQRQRSSTDTIGNSIYIVDSETGARCGTAAAPAGTRTSPLPGERWTTRSRRVSASSTSTATASPIACTPATWAARCGASTSQRRGGRDLVTGGVIAQLGGAPSATPAPGRHSAVLQRAGRGVHQHAVRQLHPRRHRLRPPRPSAEPLRRGSLLCAPRLRHGSDDAGPVRRADARSCTTTSSPVTSANASVPYGSRRLAHRSQHRRLERREGSGRGPHVREPGDLLDLPAERRPCSSCEPQLGINRTYAMAVYNGAPVLNLDDSADPTTLTMDDLFVEAEGGILSAAQALFVDRDSRRRRHPRRRGRQRRRRRVRRQR